MPTNDRNQPAAPRHPEARRPRNRFRVRRILKWVGAGMCVLTLAVWAINRHRVIWFHLPSGTICLANDNLSLSGPGLFNDFWRFKFGAFRTNAPSADAAVYRRWFPQWNGTQYLSGRPTMSWCLVLPLWMLFAVLSTATVLLFLLDRRRIPPGHCKKCGYNLTGNVSGICPECGNRMQNEECRMQNAEFRNGA